MILVLAPASFCWAEARLYQLGPVPKNLQSTPPKLAGSIQPSLRAFAGPTNIDVSRWERDFSAPINSPQFGEPIGANSGVIGSGPAAGAAAPAGSRLDGGQEAKTSNQSGTLLVDSKKGSLFLHKVTQVTEQKYLHQAGIAYSVERANQQVMARVQPEDLPRRENLLTALILGSDLPEPLIFRREKAEAKGAEDEVWFDQGFARIKIKRKKSDGPIERAWLIAPGGGSSTPITLWRVFDWKDGAPAKAVCSSYSTDGKSILNETLYTLKETKPSVERKVNDLFTPGMMVRDERSVPDSTLSETSYPWRGKLPDESELGRLSKNPNPGSGLMMEFGAIVGAALTAVLAGGLIIFGARRRTKMG